MNDNNNGLWLVILDEDGWHVCNRSYHILMKEWERKTWLLNVSNEATLLMMKHPIKRDISQAKLISTPQVAYGMPYMDSPQYIDDSVTLKTPYQVWVVLAPTRHQALKVAKKDLINQHNLLDKY